MQKKFLQAAEQYLNTTEFLKIILKTHTQGHTDTTQLGQKNINNNLVKY